MRALMRAASRLASILSPSAAILAMVVAVFPSVVMASGFIDPLDKPAIFPAQVERKPLRDIVDTGQRLVAVGDNGLIILSDDQGLNWQQASVPVGVDLNAVFFANPKQGWAVGHGAVILHSADGGRTWLKQLDGRGLEALTVDYFEHHSGLPAERAESYLTAILNMSRPGPGQFFMGVWFDGQGREGYAVGPFGLILGSSDGGKSWQPRNIRIDNNDLLHLTAIREVGSKLYISGERGRVWRLESLSNRFVVAETGYEGTLFGLAGTGDSLLAFGLRGHVFRSVDQGRSWLQVPNMITTAVTAGTALGGREMVLVSQSAQILLSRDSGNSFESLEVPRPTLFTGVVGLPGERLAVVGLGGVTTLDIGQ